MNKSYTQSKLILKIHYAIEISRRFIFYDMYEYNSGRNYAYNTPGF